MSTLAEIEAAANLLPAEDKRELIHFLAARLHGEGAETPAPRDIAIEKMRDWVADDEAGYRHFLSEK